MADASLYLPGPTQTPTDQRRPKTPPPFQIPSAPAWAHTGLLPANCQPRGRQLGGTASSTQQHRRQRGSPISPPEGVRRGRKIKVFWKKRMDGVAWQREGRAAVQQGWYPAGLSAPCALCEPEYRASPPLLLLGPTSKASLPALITHSVLLQAAIALVPKTSSKNFKKKISAEGFWIQIQHSSVSSEVQGEAAAAGDEKGEKCSSSPGQICPGLHNRLFPLFFFLVSYTGGWTVVRALQRPWRMCIQCRAGSKDLLLGHLHISPRVSGK